MGGAHPQRSFLINLKMVLKFAKELGFDTQEQYFEYIVDSRINGNLKQSRELFNNLLNDGMQGERANFWNWLGSMYCTSMEEDQRKEFFRDWEKFFCVR